MVPQRVDRLFLYLKTKNKIMIHKLNETNSDNFLEVEPYGKTTIIRINNQEILLEPEKLYSLIGCLLSLQAKTKSR